MKEHGVTIDITNRVLKYMHLMAMAPFMLKASRPQGLVSAIDDNALLP
jgi:hypothetical protein